MNNKTIGVIPRPPGGIRAAQERLQTMQEGDVVEIMTVDGFPISARRTAEGTQIEVSNIKVTVTCPEAQKMAAILIDIGAAAIFAAIGAAALVPGLDVIVIGSYTIEIGIAKEIADAIAAGWAAAALSTILARYVC